MIELGYEHDSDEWTLYNNSSKTSLKTALLYNGNVKIYIPIAQAVNIKETYKAMKICLEAISSSKHNFYFYIYPPHSQESDGGAIYRVSNYPDLLPEMPRYCCPLVI